MPLAEQPAMLDRAALEYCLADAFHPGCEVTWPVRHLTMFHAPFRIRHRPAGEPEPDYGKTLTPAVAWAANGPLYQQGPGDLTRWMGLPWQADTGFCRSGYDTDYDPYVPTFWPARVPNQVLTEPNYRVVIDTAAPRDERLAAFASRMVWTAPLTGASRAGQMEQMVRIFGDMGLVEVREGVQGDPDFPPTMMVASFGPGIQPPPPPSAGPRRGRASRPRRHLAHDPKDLLRRQATQQAGWDSESEREQAPLPVHWPKEPMSRDFAVIVAGGGPAGSAAAIVLAKSGRRVLLVDDSADAGVPDRRGLAPRGGAPAPRPRRARSVPGRRAPALLRQRLVLGFRTSSPRPTSSSTRTATAGTSTGPGSMPCCDRPREDAGAAVMSGTRVTRRESARRRILERVAEHRQGSIVASNFAATG